MRGPFHQREFSAKSEIFGSLVGISAGFISVGICFHWLGLLCVWTSPTLLETNVFKLLDGEFIQYKQFVESVQNVIVLLSKSKAFATVSPSLVPMTHAASSSLLTDSVLVGVTLAFAVMSVTAIQWFWLYCYFNVYTFKNKLGHLEGIECKVISENLLSHIWLSICAFPCTVHYEDLPNIWLCTWSNLNFLIREEMFPIFFITDNCQISLTSCINIFSHCLINGLE